MKSLLILLTTLAMLLAQSPWVSCHCGCAATEMGMEVTAVDSQQVCADCCGRLSQPESSEPTRCPCPDCPVKASLGSVPPALADCLSHIPSTPTDADELSGQHDLAAAGDRRVASLFHESRHAADPPLYTLYCLLRC